MTVIPRVSSIRVVFRRVSIVTVRLLWRFIVDGRPLSRTTYDAGFADQSHLTRRFAALFGVTPARYARQLAVPPGAASSSPFGTVQSAVPLPAA